jgi:hypothetical protein
LAAVSLTSKILAFVLRLALASVVGALAGMLLLSCFWLLIIGPVDHIRLGPYVLARLGEWILFGAHWGSLAGIVVVVVRSAGNWFKGVS